MTTRNLATWYTSAATGKIDFSVTPEGSSKYPTYTPIVNVKLNSYASGAASPIFGMNSPIVTTEISGVNQPKCIRLKTNPTQPDVTCGNHNFGGRMTLPTPIPVGKTVWQRMKFFFPTEFSFGYAFGKVEAEDKAGATACGVNYEGSGTGIKFMTFSPDVGSARTYLNMPTSRRSINQTLGTGTLAIESNPGAQQSLNVVFPRGQWFTLEIACKVSNSIDPYVGEGYFRCWMDGVLIASIGGATGDKRTLNPVASNIVEYGVGDYFNGTPWTDGAAGRDTFYVDEVLVATDIDGFGAPTATDANGYPMIGVDVKNSDFH